MWLVQHMAWVTLLFFPFFQRGVYMALCSWNKDLVWMELRLAGMRPKNFSAYPSSLLFLGKIVSPSSWNSNRPHPRAIIAFLGVGAVSGFHHPPPPLFSFYFRTVHISWNPPQEHVWGFELGPLFPQLTATFRPLWCGPVSECNSVSFTGLSFHWCQRGDDTWSLYDRRSEVIQVRKTFALRFWYTAGWSVYWDALR